MKQMSRSSIPCLVFTLLWTGIGLAQDLREQAAAAWELAQQEEAIFRSLPAQDRTRNAHLRIIQLYERVYLTTPHSGYADDALTQIATLYEETGAAGDAIRTLRFLVSDYPGSRHVADAQTRISRLTGSVPAAAETETASAPGGDGVSVDNIRYWESDDSLRVVVDVEGQPVFTRGEAQNPPRVYVDIANARLSTALDRREFPVESDMLHGIRVGQYDADTVRVVLDLADAGDVAAFTLGDPNRIVIDVLLSQSGAPAAAARRAGSPPPDPAAATADVRPAAEPAADARNPGASPAAEAAASEPARLGTAALPTENGDHTLSRSLGLKVHRVVIDPGHGGHDPGTIGPSGLSEAELVLDIARRLKERIEADIPNAEVMMTRDNDTFVPLEARPSLANQAQADLFISIHANSSRTRSIRGFETYFLNLNPSPEAMEIAARENAASERPLSDLQDIVSQIMMQEWVDESREFAGHIQKALASQTLLGRDRGVKQAPLVVLLGANMPSILAEVSFISNPEDELLLKGAERRQQIADALFEGVRSYFSTLSGFRTAEVRD